MCILETSRGRRRKESFHLFVYECVYLCKEYKHCELIKWEIKRTQSIQSRNQNLLCVVYFFKGKERLSDNCVVVVAADAADASNNNNTFEGYQQYFRHQKQQQHLKKLGFILTSTDWGRENCLRLRLRNQNICAYMCLCACDGSCHYTLFMVDFHIFHIRSSIIIMQK